MNNVKPIGLTPPRRGVAETAQLLGLSEKTVRRLIASGALVAHRVGRSVRISDADLRVFLNHRRG
jgi:excisionase family DNA binding protein